MAEIYVPGAIDIMGSANQMMQFRNSQQAQQANALQMQYTMEDRARADQARKVAAGNALADQARKRELLEIYSNFGVTPAVIGQRGQSYSGAGVANDPYADIQNKLLTKGFASQAGDIAELQNKNLTGKKTEAETAGQKATNKGLDIKNIDARLNLVKQFATSVTTADSAANFALIMAREFPEFAELYGSPKDAAERSAALFNKDPDAWQRHSVSLTGEQLVKATADAKAAKAPVPKEMDVGGSTLIYDSNSRSPTYLKELKSVDKTLTPAEAKPAAAVPTNLAKLIAERDALPEGSPNKNLFNSAIDKELNIPGVAGTEKERAFAILAQGTVNPSIVNTPAYRAALAIASQSEIKSVVGPNSEVKYVSVAPSLPSWVVLPKENGVAQQTFAGAVAQRQTTPTAFTNALTQAGGAAPQVNNLVAPPAAAPTAAPATAPAAAAVPVDNRPDANVVSYRETDANGDVSGFNKYGVKITMTENAGKPSAEVEKQRNANKRIAITINELEKILKPGGLIEKATGSAIGAGRDYAASIIGETTEGAAAIAALKPIYDLVLKTVPRFEGPQSNADIISYKDAAGRLADPLATFGEKQAAGKTILRLMKLYAGQFDILPDGAKGAGQSGSGATNTAVDETNPLFLLKPGAN